VVRRIFAQPFETERKRKRREGSGANFLTLCRMISCSRGGEGGEQDELLVLRRRFRDQGKGKRGGRGGKEVMHLQHSLVKCVVSRRVGEKKKKRGQESAQPAPRDGGDWGKKKREERKISP